MKKYFVTALRDYDFPLSVAAYLSADVDAREAQLIAIDRAQKAKIEKQNARIEELEKALRWVMDNGSAPNHVPSDVARTFDSLMERKP